MKRDEYHQFFKKATIEPRGHSEGQFNIFQVKTPVSIYWDQLTFDTNMRIVKELVSSILGRFSPGLPFSEDFYANATTHECRKYIEIAGRLSRHAYSAAVTEGCMKRWTLMKDVIDDAYAVTLNRSGYSSDSDAFENFRQYTVSGHVHIYPVFQAAMRIMEKVRRVENVKNDSSKSMNEPLYETLIDIGNLGVIIAAMLSETSKEVSQNAERILISKMRAISGPVRPFRPENMITEGEV